MNTTNRIYESMYIVDSGLSDEQLESIIAKYTQLVTDNGGTVQAAGRWDKRRLAYDVMGHGDGIFVLMFFEGAPEVEKELDRVFRISDDVFRHLITRVEPEHVDTSRINQPVVEEVTAAAPVAEAKAEEEPVAEAAEEAVEAAPGEAPVAEEAGAAEPVAEEAAEVPEESTPAEEATEEPAAEQSEAAEETASESKKES